MNLRVLYFAVLREKAGMATETVDAPATTPRALYEWVRARHGFALEGSRVLAAVNGAFAPADHPLAENDEVAFLPPVAGG